MASTSPSQSIILESEYKFSLEVPKEETIPEYVINRAQYFHSIGRKAWMTNTVTGETFNFNDIEPLSRKIASGLFKRGFRRQDVLLFTSHDGAKCHLLFLGVWRANGQVRLSYAEDSVETQRERLIESQAKWYACDPETLPQAKEAIENLGVPWDVELIVFGPKAPDGSYTSVYDLLEDDGMQCPPVEIQSADTSFILATSGTTGASKGALYTHQMTMSNLVMYEKHPFTPDPTQPALIITKATHFLGSHLPLTCITTGKRTLIINPVSSENICRAIHEYKPTGIYSFPKFLLQVIEDPTSKKYDFSSIKIALTAGTVIGPSTVDVIKKLPCVDEVIVFYGMTECGLFTSTMDYDAQRSLHYKNLKDLPSSSVGKLAPDTSLRVIDVTSGKDLGAHQFGELAFRTKLVCGGYLNNEQENSKCFPGGWILTGDMGYYDEDGFIFVVDRLKEVFKYQCNHITPSELERVIASHPAVIEAVVIGIPHPDPSNQHETIPRAFVTVTNSNSVTSAEILSYANSKLPDYKHIRGGLMILLPEELPLGKTGKVSKALLAQKL